MSHLFSKKKCFEKATWIGNFYTCPVCHRNIAIGFDNRIFPFPRYESCGDLLYKIPKQPAWYTEQSADELKDFMEEVTEHLRDKPVFSDDEQAGFSDNIDDEMEDT
mgnify:FL=1